MCHPLIFVVEVFRSGPRGSIEASPLSRLAWELSKDICLFPAETNNVRLFFRLIFTIAALVLGIDGLTEKKRINRNQSILRVVRQT